MPLPDNDLTYCVIGCSRWVYNDFGPGLLESTYAGAFLEACRSKGLSTEREVFVPVYFNGVQVATYRLDVVVEHRLIVELKSCKTLVPAHIKQVFHYLRVTDFELALLFNFGPTLEVKRFTLRNSLKYRRAG
jgi:GxxExxY protein